MKSETIWKFPLELHEEQKIEMPKGANIIHCAEQHDRICLWAEVDPKASKVYQTFYVLGTGWDHRPKSAITHVGSVVMSKSPFVWHVYGKVE